MNEHSVLKIHVKHCCFIITKTIMHAGGFTSLISCTKRFNEKGKKTPVIFICLTALVVCFLLCFFGPAVYTIKGAIFFLILLLSSYLDIKTRQVDNYLSVMIAITAFIGLEVYYVPSMLVSAAVVGLSMLMGALFTKGRTIGGADIKLSVASAFLLSSVRGFVGAIFGLLIGIIANTVFNRKKALEQGFPLVPYLTAGFILAYFI